MQRRHIGYIRVSTLDQNPERQPEQIQIDNQFIDKASGKDTKRPELDRLLKLAREGAQMTGQHLRDLEPLRRYATLVAVVLQTHATLTDKTVDLHEWFMNTLFSKAKGNHADNVLQSGKAINRSLRGGAMVQPHHLMDRTSEPVGVGSSGDV